jgi:hypothetical protein
VSWKITCRYRNENDHQSLEMSHSLYNDWKVVHSDAGNVTSQ